MKTINTIILSLCICLLQAQNIMPAKPRLSAGAMQYLWKLDHEATERPYVFPGYVYRNDAQNNLYVSALIKVEQGFNEAALNDLGVRVNTKAGNIWTAQVPVERVRDFVQVSGIRFIEMDEASAPLLDSARVATHVDSVHAGYGLPQPYTGKNVVVGIIDAGFDYTHPIFYDTAYQTYRVKKVWEEKTVGTPPVGFSYGNEYSDSASIQAKTHDIITGSHGTHVSGIAAGSGVGGDSTNARYRGMAYNSDIVLVAISPTLSYWLNTGMADMLDGIHYVFNYAQSVSKPAVANLSWGCPLGPHDGNSLFSQALDNLTGSGKIFVLSAGNNGTDKIHIQKTFSGNDISLNTFVTFSSSLPSQTNRVDVWGDSAESFCMKFSLYNNNTRKDSTGFICLDNTTHLITLVGTNGDTCFITATAVANEFNDKPHMLLDIYSRTTDRLCLNVIATSGTVNMWQGYVLQNTGYYGMFTKYNYAWATSGDNIMQVSDMVTSRSAIGVAAYNSKVSFVNVSGQNMPFLGFTKGAIASFSSHGPTADGRTKPDIAGPGMALSSAINSADSTLMSGGADYNLVTSKFVSPLNGKTYSYAVFQGTSMSSPSVSGIVALLLEVNPNLSPQGIKNILAQTAITDSYTGTIPAQGSNTWGFGKVNAYEAIKKALETTGIFHNETTLPCLVFPNPGNGVYSIQFYSEKNEMVNVKVYSLLGNELINERWQTETGNNIRSLNLSSQPEGIYFVRIESGNNRAVVKLLKQ
jgi:subtilisin family serine protease